MAETPLDTHVNTHVETRTFSTVNDLPTSVRYDIWKSSIDCIFDVETKPDIQNHDLHSAPDADLVGTIMLARAVGPHVRPSQSPRASAFEAKDHYMLQYFHSGGMPLENGAEDEKLAHGGFLFQDLSQVARTMAADADNVVMILPRHLLESRLTFPEDHNMRFLSPRDPMVRILASMMLSFKANAYSFTAAQASILENSFVEVLAACLNAAHSGTSETALQQPHRETIALVRQYFRKNFTLPDLTPERAARELGISRSKLYQLMEDHGGVNRYVRDLRLRHAMNLLGAPAERGRSLYDIALECGFTSDTSFIRAFREKYGTTPGDFRRNSQAGCR